MLRATKAAWPRARSAATSRAACTTRVAGVSAARRHASTAAARYLDIKLPEQTPLRQDIPDPTPVPYVFDMWDSHTKHVPQESESHAEASELPRVLTVASAATHPAGGPSSNVYQSSTTGAQDAPTTDTRQPHAPAGFFRSISDDLGLPTTSRIQDTVIKLASGTSDEPASASYQTYRKPLDETEKNGLLILVGLITGCWIAGGIFAPRPRVSKHASLNNQH